MLGQKKGEDPQNDQLGRGSPNIPVREGMRRGLEDAHRTTAREVRGSNPAIYRLTVFFRWARTEV